MIGAGITGVTTAHLLKQAGKTVALIETNGVGYGATGYTTAKLTVGHTLIYHDLIESFGEAAARAYARSNQEAIERIQTIVRDNSIDCDLRACEQLRLLGARTHRCTTSSRRRRLRDTSASTRSSRPRPTFRTRFEPRCASTTKRSSTPGSTSPRSRASVDGDGSHVLESTRATDVRNGSPCEVETTSGIVRATHVVVATQMPFLDRGLYFTRAHPMKSYVVAAPIDTERAPRGMYISVDHPTRSIRSTPADDGGRMLIVGGEGHKPGADPDANARYSRLEVFMRERFGLDSAEYHWSTHDYMPVDKLPYIGRLRRGVDNVYVATGFAKWGAAPKAPSPPRSSRDTILGRTNEWAEPLRLDPT